MKQKKENLEKIIESLEKKVHGIISEDREGQFLVDYKGKKVILILSDKEVEGELLDIDKNRVMIRRGEQEIFYYKHAVRGYYAKN